MSARSSIVSDSYAMMQRKHVLCSRQDDADYARDVQNEMQGIRRERARRQGKKQMQRYLLIRR